MNDLKKEYGDKVEFVTVKVGSDAVVEEIKKAGLKSHGIIGKNGAGKVISTVEGHNYQKDKVLEVVKTLLVAK